MQEEYEREKEKLKKTEIPKIKTREDGVNYKFSYYYRILLIPI
jgi:hypothetical protein